jgi:hypothetical protein
MNACPGCAGRGWVEAGERQRGARMRCSMCRGAGKVSLDKNWALRFAKTRKEA